MKTLVILTLAAVLLLSPATVVLADSEVSPSMNAHDVAMILRGASYGETAQQSDNVEPSPVNSFDVGMIRRGPNVEPSPVNSFDLAMLRRGPTVERSAVNSFDAAMLNRGPLRGWMAQRGIAQIAH